MGFYIDLKRVTPNSLDFSETKTPQVFWMLFGLAGFALTCMGLAAHNLLLDLLKSGDLFDTLLVGGVTFFVPAYFITGIKLAVVRKKVKFSGEYLVVGFFMGQIPVWFKKISRVEIDSYEIINRRPSPNVAAKRHQDSQYHIRGHWRLMLKLKNGKSITLDRHTEKGALHSLQNSLRTWLKSS